MAFCAGCDNRHGCRDGQAICLILERAPDEKRLRGKALMRKRGLLDRCPACAHFKRCWGASEYRKACEDTAGE